MIALLMLEVEYRAFPLILQLGDSNLEYKTWMCVVCGLIYDEEEGWPEDGIAPGTQWQDVPVNWCCPDCGSSKDDFEMIEVWSQQARHVRSKLVSITIQVFRR